MIFLSFIAGVILASAVCYIVFSKKNLALKEEIITLSAKSKSTEELQEIIKRDFVQLANETIKNEQEDLRKQNRETLEEKILPLTKELGEFKAKVERFNLAGVENTTKIVEQIGNLEKNNKIIVVVLQSINHETKIYNKFFCLEKNKRNIFYNCKINNDENNFIIYALITIGHYDCVKYSSKFIELQDTSKWIEWFSKH